MFQLRKLGVSTDLQSGLSLLNQWHQACGTPASSTPDSGKWPPALRDQLPKSVLERLEDDRFTRRDGEHLRDCVLYQAVARYAIGDADSDLQRVTRLFQHVVRNLSPGPQHPEGVPLSSYESYLLGRGTDADRAWLFAGLLRQLRIDAVLLRPQQEPAATDTTATDTTATDTTATDTATDTAAKASAEAEPTGNPAEKAGTPKAETLPQEDRFLVAVLLNDQIYLFDPRLGVPVPSLKAAAPKTSDALSPFAVATLQEAAADPAVLEQLATEETPYFFSHETIRKPAVAIIGESSQWARRMQELQSELTGQQSLFVYEDLADGQAGAGVWSRVLAAAADGDTSRLTVWSYPESQLIGSEELQPQHRQVVQQLLRVFDAPLAPEAQRDQQGNQKIGFVPTRQLWGARLAHINGEFEEAIVTYTNIRLGAKLRLPLAIQVINQRGADNANYWMGVCQLEQARYRVAAETFTKYLKANPEGAWVSAAQYHLALCLAARQDYTAAIAALEEIPADHPEHAGYALLIRKWQTRSQTAAPEKETTSRKAEDTPKDPKKAAEPTEKTEQE